MQQRNWTEASPYPSKIVRVQWRKCWVLIILRLSYVLKGERLSNLIINFIINRIYCTVSNILARILMYLLISFYLATASSNCLSNQFDSKTINLIIAGTAVASQPYLLVQKFQNAWEILMTMPVILKLFLTGNYSYK